jgi:hypothetical protein
MDIAGRPSALRALPIGARKNVRTGRHRAGATAGHKLAQPRATAGTPHAALIRPMKWSDLRYVFDLKEDCNGQHCFARRHAARRSGVPSPQPPTSVPW